MRQPRSKPGAGSKACVLSTTLLPASRLMERLSTLLPTGCSPQLAVPLPPGSRWRFFEQTQVPVSPKLVLLLHVCLSRGDKEGALKLWQIQEHALDSAIIFHKKKSNSATSCLKRVLYLKRALLLLLTILYISRII